MQKRPSYLNDNDCLLARENGIATFALFASKPSNFKDASNEDVWIKAIHEEIYVIDKKQYMGTY